MNIPRLIAILRDTTRTFRKGAEVVRQGNVTEFFDYPSVAVADATRLTLIDVHFVVVGVDLALAMPLRAELVGILNEYPALSEGLSYIAVGAMLGDQVAALRLFALGATLDLWTVITPAGLGIDGPDAERLAGMGYVMNSGYTPEPK